MLLYEAGFIVTCILTGVAFLYFVTAGVWRLWRAESREVAFSRWRSDRRGYETSWLQAFTWLSPASSLMDQLLEKDGEARIAMARANLTQEGRRLSMAPEYSLLRMILDTVNYNVGHHAQLIAIPLVILLNAVTVYLDAGLTVRTDGAPATWSIWLTWSVCAFVAYSAAAYLTGTVTWGKVALYGVAGGAVPVLMTLGVLCSGTLHWIFFGAALLVHLIAFALYLYDAVFSQWASEAASMRTILRSSRTARDIAIGEVFFIYAVLTVAVVVGAFGPEFGGQIASPTDANLGQVIMQLVFLVGVAILSTSTRVYYEYAELRYAEEFFPALTQGVRPLYATQMETYMAQASARPDAGNHANFGVGYNINNNRGPVGGIRDAVPQYAAYPPANMRVGRPTTQFS
jgi:hypothetical protein